MPQTSGSTTRHHEISPVITQLYPRAPRAGRTWPSSRRSDGYFYPADFISIGNNSCGRVQATGLTTRFCSDVRAHPRAPPTRPQSGDLHGVANDALPVVLSQLGDNPDPASVLEGILTHMRADCESNEPAETASDDSHGSDEEVQGYFVSWPVMQGLRKAAGLRPLAPDGSTASRETSHAAASRRGHNPTSRSVQAPQSLADAMESLSTQFQLSYVPSAQQSRRDVSVPLAGASVNDDPDEEGGTRIVPLVTWPDTGSQSMALDEDDDRSGLHVTTLGDFGGRAASSGEPATFGSNDAQDDPARPGSAQQQQTGLPELTVHELADILAITAGQEMWEDEIRMQENESGWIEDVLGRQQSAGTFKAKSLQRVLSRLRPPVQMARSALVTSGGMPADSGWHPWRGDQ